MRGENNSETWRQTDGGAEDVRDADRQRETQSRGRGAGRGGQPENWQSHRAMS